MFEHIFTSRSLLTAAFVAAVGPAGVGAQAADKTLTVYTYESFTSEWGPGPKVKEAFEKTRGCSVNFVSVADGVALLSRLKLEGAATKADVVLGLDTNLTTEAKATGLFEASGVDVAALKVPGDFKDDVFVPYDYGHFAVIYDTQTIKNPPQSMKELVEGDPSQKIVIEDPRTSTPGLGLLLWVKAIYGDKSPGSLGKTQEARADGNSRLVRGLWAVHQGRGRRWCSPTRPRPPTIWSRKIRTAIRLPHFQRAITYRSKWPAC